MQFLSAAPSLAGAGLLDSGVQGLLRKEGTIRGRIFSLLLEINAVQNSSWKLALLDMTLQLVQLLLLFLHPALGWSFTGPLDPISGIGDVTLSELFGRDGYSTWLTATVAVAILLVATLALPVLALRVDSANVQKVRFRLTGFFQSMLTCPKQRWRETLPDFPPIHVCSTSGMRCGCLLL